MPTMPPRFRPSHLPERKAWEPTRRMEHDRIRGRAGVKLRNRVKDEEPLCRVCTAEGRVSAATEVDHIVSLADGGSNERANLQGLCADCHAAKSAAERGRAARARGSRGSHGGGAGRKSGA